MSREARAPPPAPGSNLIPAGVLVCNNSYVADASSFFTPAVPIANQELDFRTDWLAANNPATIVAGVALDNATYKDCTGMWSAYNVIAVRGNASDTPFQTQYLSAGITPDRLTPDLWQQRESSYASGTVSGYSAALIGNAQLQNASDAVHPQVVKSLLMTGASRQGIDATGNPTTWSPTTANHLDPLAGAGQANYAGSLGVLNGGERAAMTVSSGAVAVSGGVSASPSGWTYAPSIAGGQTAILFQQTVSATGFIATLNWDVAPKTNSDGTIDTTAADLIFPHLSLQLVPASYNANTGQFVLGSALADPGLSSSDASDNVQSLYSGNTLSPGVYALVIGGDANTSVYGGLSYLATPSSSSSIWAAASGSWASAHPLGLPARRPTAPARR